MKAVPYNKDGLGWDAAMLGDCDVLETTADATFEGLFAKWIDAQAGGEELGGEGGDGTWTFDFGDEGDTVLSGSALVAFVQDQVAALPVGFWILEDLHFEAAVVPLDETAEHGGATIHACAEVSFMRICALLAVRFVGSPVRVPVPGGGGGDE